MNDFQSKKIIITNDIFEKCTEFANNSVSSSVDKYSKRNQSSVSKIIEDIRNGKIAEELVWFELSKTYPDLSKPDHIIYDKKNKSWEADLKSENAKIKFAVKSQDIKSEIAYGKSWVFQYREGAKYDCDVEIFGDSNSAYDKYVCFVSLNVPKRTANLCAIIKVKFLHENNLFKPMQLKNLQNNKVAVYYDDLKTYA